MKVSLSWRVYYVVKFLLFCVFMAYGSAAKSAPIVKFIRFLFRCEYDQKIFVLLKKKNLTTF